MLSFKDNFEVNNEIKDVTETIEAPEHILLIQFVGLEETACVYFCFSEFSLQKTPEPLSFLTAGCSQPALFLLGLFLRPLAGSLQIPPAPPRPLPLPMLVPIVSTAKCDASILFLVFVFVLFLCFVWNFFLSY